MAESYGLVMAKTRYKSLLSLYVRHALQMSTRMARLFLREKVSKWEERECIAAGRIWSRLQTMFDTKKIG
jgi:hypothetical protein